VFDIMCNWDYAPNPILKIDVPLKREKLSYSIAVRCPNLP
jgi:hypothetical protein